MNQLLELRKRYDKSGQLAEELYLTMSDAITSGVFAPGDRVYEEDLAEQFCVSRTPVREAIKRLEAEGLVCTNAKRGFQVRVFSDYECEELVLAMEMFRQITTRTAAFQISKPYLIQLQENIDAMVCLPQDAINDRHLLNEKFHEIIVSSIGNSVINDLYSRMMKKFYLVFANKVSNMTYDMGGQEEHIRILEALKRHDPDQSFALAIQHSERSYQRIRQLQKNN